MGFDKPSDIIVMFGIFALVMVVIGIGIESINSAIYQNAGINTSYFDSINTNTGGRFRNTTVSAGEGLVDTAGLGDTPSEENIFVKSWNAIKSIGNTYNLVEGAVEEGSQKLGIPEVFFWVINGILVTIFAVVTYSWFRGAK